MTRAIVLIPLLTFSLAAFANDERDKAIAAKLKAALLSHNPANVHWAVAEIRGRSDQFTINNILDGLQSDNPDVRELWSQAAVGHRGEKFVKGIVGLYEQNKMLNKRLEIVAATLGTQEEELKTLQKVAFYDPSDVNVRLEAMTCLFEENTLENRTQLEELIFDARYPKTLRYFAIRLLIGHDSKKWEELTDPRKTADEDLRFATYRFLDQRAPSYSGGLIRAIHDPDAHIRELGIHGLAPLGLDNETVLNAFIWASKPENEPAPDNRAFVVKTLIESLSSISESVLLGRVKKALEKSIYDKEPFVFMEIADALNRQDAPPPVALFEIVFESKNNNFVDIAAHALESWPSILRARPDFIGNYHDPQQLERLAKILSPKNPFLAHCKSEMHREGLKREAKVVH